MHRFVQNWHLTESVSWDCCHFHFNDTWHNPTRKLKMSSKYISTKCKFICTTKYGKHCKNMKDILTVLKWIKIFLPSSVQQLRQHLMSSSQCNFQYKRIIRVYINHIFIALPLEDEMIFPTGCLRN